jgi:virginiamycin B lyase
MPWGIAAGSDGALWFTENAANRIGRITTAGAITELPVPTAAAAPTSIAAGPDGNLWITESGASRIARLTPAGVFTEFLLPATTRSFGIAAGPDGALWFTEFDTSRIGRITTSGGLSEFLIPTAETGPLGVAAGPDGNVWFTEFRVAAIGRVVPPPPVPGSAFSTVAPCRILDTRNAAGPWGSPALLANTDRLFTLAGRCGVPTDARALAVNVTVTSASAAGALSFRAAGAILTGATTISYGAGQTRANNAVVAVSAAGDVLVRCAQSSGTVHLVVDVTGWFR